LEFHDEVVFHDPEYRKLGEEPQQLMEQLNAKLTPAGKEMSDRFDCARTEQMNRQDELIYSQGLMDGILLGYWVALIGQGMEKIKV
jgi:hypothetical protein